jgi:hypothetical protein
MYVRFVSAFSFTIFLPPAKTTKGPGQKPEAFPGCPENLQTAIHSFPDSPLYEKKDFLELSY